MITRRSLALTALNATLGATLGAALVPAAAFAGRPQYVGGDQRPTLIPGTPPQINFGHDLIVPASGDALRTLWEGDDRYVAFGIAASLSEPRAFDRAELAAIGTMQLMLLTRAFAPDRLVRYGGCGWRSASGSIGDLVQGQIALPGRPYRPLRAQGGSSPDDAAPDDALGSDAVAGADTVMGAACVYMVLKRDAGLDFIRANARLVCSQPGADPVMAAREACAPQGPNAP